MRVTAPHLEDEPARGNYTTIDDLALPGIERMRSLMRAGVSGPPISHLTGLQFVEIGAGLATCVLPATEWLLAGTGSYGGGVLALPADAALGGSLITLLEPGQILTTSEISLSYLRPAGPASDHLIARGRLVHAARTLGLSDVFIEDARGRLLAHGSSRCVFMPAPMELRVPPSEPPRDDLPDPYLRPVIGEAFETKFAEMSYVEMFDRIAAGKLPAPPICNLFGLRLIEHGAGSMAWSMPASPWLNNAFGVVYGGALALLADSAVAGAIWMTMERGQVLASLNLHLYFFRPVFADGRDIVARGAVTRAGRSLRVAGAELFDADGNLVASATGSGKVVSDRPPSLKPPSG